jgi:small subunit ribosomal protein S16
MGKKKQPTYRVVAADSHKARNGRFIEIVGIYEPRQDPSVIQIDNDKAVAWLQKGAQPTERVEKLLKISGAWEAFTGQAPEIAQSRPKAEKKKDREQAAKADEPAAKADEPAAKADEQAAKADEPAAKADEPAAEPADATAEAPAEPEAAPDGAPADEAPAADDTAAASEASDQEG